MHYPYPDPDPHPDPDPGPSHDPSYNPNPDPQPAHDHDPDPDPYPDPYLDLDLDLSLYIQTLTLTLNLLNSSNNHDGCNAVYETITRNLNITRVKHTSPYHSDHVIKLCHSRVKYKTLILEVVCIGVRIGLVWVAGFQN